MKLLRLFVAVPHGLARGALCLARMHPGNVVCVRPLHPMEIYIPPSRAHKATSISLGLTAELPDDVGVLEDAAKEIENAISHLKRSNKEIQEFDPNGDDPELVDAIAGNIVALAKKEVRLQQIREKMATLGARSDPCVHSATATEQPTTANKAASSSAGTSPEGGQSPLATRAAIPTTAAPAAEHAPAECTGLPPVVGLSERMRTLDITKTPAEDFEGGIDL